MQVRETPPFAPVLMESTRAIGYSLEAAIADRNVERDNQSCKELESLGWKVITVWECELKKKAFEETMRKIIQQIVSEKQGLEIDYSLLAWDADLRRSDDDFDYFKFRGTRWNHVNNLQQQKYLKNAYRVLMTRARQGVVIFIPEGVDPEEDSSRSHFYYDDIYKYLRSCGIIELE